MSPIYVLPFAGVLFIIGAFIFQGAGAQVQKDDYHGWFVLTVYGLVFQVVAGGLTISAVKLMALASCN